MKECAKHAREEDIDAKVRRNFFPHDDSLTLQLVLIHAEYMFTSNLFPSKSITQPNGDGSKVTPSLKGLADVTVVNIPCSLTNKVNCKQANKHKTSEISQDY